LKAQRIVLGQKKCFNGMEVSLSAFGKKYTADLKKGIDLSIPVQRDGKLNAYFAPKVTMEPYKSGDWIGEVASGGSVNYRNISFNPHGNCTHTECVGHIDKTIHSVNRNFKQFHSIAHLISVTPEQFGEDDKVITAGQLREVELDGADAVIIRTFPNEIDKRGKNYSGSNPPYLLPDAVGYLVELGCRHLILDLPSIDKEEDGGKLLGHKAFWNYPETPRMDCTVTELAYIPDEATDGLYFLNLQVAPFENDAAPSRPVIFHLSEI